MFTGLKGKEGDTVSFDKVLIIDDDKDVKVGAPTIEGASVSAKILTHLKGDKVLVFKKKRRKSYQKLNGHRQFFTQLLIEEISGSGKPKAKRATKKATAVADVQTEEIKEN